jgi:3D (Asp-Asp-Asp) domain-containing protein
MSEINVDISEYEHYNDEKQRLLNDLELVITNIHNAMKKQILDNLIKNVNIAGLNIKDHITLNNALLEFVYSKIYVEGNIFYTHGSLTLNTNLHTKQANIFWCGKQAKMRICEIGFNAGHSSMVMLLGRDKTPIDFTIFDINHLAYTEPCVKYISTAFPHVKFSFVKGDSTITMPIWIAENPSLIGQYDLIHVDGGHSEHCIINDMKNTDILIKLNGIVIVDDTDGDIINNIVNKYIETGNYKELFLLKTYDYPHRILQKIR